MPNSVGVGKAPMDRTLIEHTEDDVDRANPIILDRTIGGEVEASVTDGNWPGGSPQRND
jgi:hypothetical protein